MTVAEGVAALVSSYTERDHTIHDVLLDSLTVRFTPKFVKPFQAFVVMSPVRLIPSRSSKKRKVFHAPSENHGQDLMKTQPSEKTSVLEFFFHSFITDTLGRTIHSRESVARSKGRGPLMVLKLFRYPKVGIEDAVAFDEYVGLFNVHVSNLLALNVCEAQRKAAQPLQ